jgi:peptidyl-prolyl cis-trans isomerase A (cyclophilin A)
MRLRVAVFALAALAAFAAAPAKPKVLFSTSKGDFTVELDPQAAPKTVANFLQYVRDGFYQGTTFHRVIPGFMIQGGGMLAGGVEKGGTRAPIVNEANNGLHNVRGSIAMARTSQPQSATAQFFVDVVDNAFLDYPGTDGWGYCVFGKVVAGMDTVDKIRAVPTQMDQPIVAVTINSARLVGAK